MALAGDEPVSVIGPVSGPGDGRAVRPYDAPRAEAAIPHPIDPVQLAEAVTRLLGPRVPATTT